MPYIKKEDYERVHTTGPENAGELNFMITQTILKYWERGVAQNYQCINDIVGALEGAKLEFVRRVVNPYEDTKIQQNGDVYK